MIGRVGHRLVAQVPLAGEARGVAILLEEFGNGRRLRPQIIFVTRSNHDGQRRTDGNASGKQVNVLRLAGEVVIEQ
jgi:hypothetical protein